MYTTLDTLLITDMECMQLNLQTLSKFEKHFDLIYTLITNMCNNNLYILQMMLYSVKDIHILKTVLIYTLK